MADPPGPLRALFPFQRKFVMTADEVRDLSGKIIGFLKTFRHPRILLPEIHPYVIQYNNLLFDLVPFGKTPFDEEKKAFVEFCYHFLKCLEEVIVRVVIRNEEVLDVLNAMKARIIASDVVAFEELIRNPFFAQYFTDDKYRV